MITLARWLLTFTLVGAAVAPATAACAAAAKPGLQATPCCQQADGACHLMTCSDAPSAEPTAAAPAPHATMILAALPHAPQKLLTAPGPASALEVPAPATIPKHYLRTHTLRL